MEKAVIRVLLIEDNPADSLLLRKALSKETLAAFVVTEVERLVQALQLVQTQSFDVALLDLGLPDSEGLGSFQKLHRQRPELPIVVLSGLLDEQLAIKAVQAGAQDYLVKGQTGWALASRAIRYAIERQQSQAELQARERHFRTLIEHSADAIVLVSADGVVLYESPAARRILGYQAETLTPANLFSFLQPEEMTANLALIDAVQQNPRAPILFQAQMRRSGDEWIWLEGTAVNLLLEPDVKAIVLNFRDITERKLAEERQRKSEANYRSLFENVPDGVYRTTPDGHILSANSALAHMLGYASPTELQTRPILDLYVNPQIRHAEMQSFHENDEVHSQEIYLQRKDGQGITCLDSARAVRDGAGQILYFEGVLVDITKRKQAEAEVTRLHRELELILNSAGEGIYGVDTDGKVTFVNPAMAQMLGWEAPALIGQVMHNVCHHTRADGSPYPISECPLDFAILSGIAYHSDQEAFWRKDGSSFPVECTSTHLRDDSKVSGTVVIVKDITERRRAEEQASRNAARALALAQFSQILAAATTHYQSLVDTLAQQVSRLVGDGCIIQLISEEDRALRTVAMDHSERSSLVDLHPVAQDATAPFQEDLPAARSTLSDAMSGLRSLPVDDRSDAMQGVLNAWAELYGAADTASVPLRVQGTVIGRLTTIRGAPYTENEVSFLQDLADRAALAIANARLLEQVQRANLELEKRVAERTAELERAARAKDEFLASMSHELRTPLNAVLTFTESLEEGTYGALNERQHRPLRNIAESGHHLLNLINDILDLAKIEAGKQELKLATVNIDTVCQASLRLMREQALKKRMSLAYQIDQAVTTLRVDERALKQMLINLLSNAIKFTPMGGRTGLEVSASPERNAVLFSVWDTGIGIADEQAQRLFKPFVQVDSGLARQYGGTGLGLSLVYRLAEMHGGSITLESSVGQGSRFTIALPWTEEHDLEADALLAPVVRRALIVEDSPAAVEQMSLYLEDLGAQVTVDLTGDNVLARIHATQPEVILLDVRLPNRSGWQVVEQIKADATAGDIPIILVTVVDDPGPEKTQTVVDYLVKPITRQRLYTALRKTFPTQKAWSSLAPSSPDRPMPVLLIAEDNPISQTTYSDTLIAKGYRVFTAFDGLEAVESAYQTRPDLILMDLQMPRLDGWEALRRLRADPEMQATPVIILSALEIAGERQRCLAAGANDYLVKPVSAQQLAQLIESYVKR